MVEEKKQVLAETEKPGIKPASVAAAALAAITAALLGSTLGVAGTVLGAGVASVVTTIGGELYLRSLQRTREAAQRAKALAVLGARRAGVRQGSATEAFDEEKIDEEETESAARRWKPRWPLIIGTSVVAFVLAIVAITVFESATGTKWGGGSGTTIGRIVGGGGHPTDQPKQAPSPQQGTPSPTSQTPTTTTTVTTTAPTSTTTVPTTTDSPPSTTPAPSSSTSPPAGKTPT